MAEYNAWENMNKLMNVEELRGMVVAREEMRLLYAELQTAAQATNNPLFLTMLDVVSRTGKLLNVQIQDWFDRVQTEHGEYSPEDPRS